MYAIRSYYDCSGSLVNNVNEDATPYFLTANHCISSDLEASSLVAYFNYENSTCTSADASLDQTISGSELVASSSSRRRSAPEWGCRYRIPGCGGLPRIRPSRASAGPSRNNFV